MRVVPPHSLPQQRSDIPSFLVWSLAAYGFTIMTIIVFREYFDIPYLPSISFIADDGWCSAATEGVGRHCFGDFQDVYSKNLYSPWDWVAPFSHPPLSHAVQQAFGLLGTFSESKRLALALWLSFSAAILLIPAAWAMRGGNRLHMSAIFVVLGLGSLPILVTLDRGNSIFLLVGLSFGMAWSISRDRLALAVSFAVCASLIRPQAILLGMAFLAIGRARLFFLSSLLSVAGLILSFLIYPGDRIGNFLQWMTNLISYQEYSSVFNEQAPNLSALRAVVYVEDIATSSVKALLGLDAQGAAGSPVSVLASFSQLSRVYSVIMALVVVIAGILMYRRRGQLSLPVLILIPSLLVILVPQTSFLYYTALLLVPFAFMARPSHFAIPHVTFVQGIGDGITRLLVATTSILAVVTFVPLMIPSSLIPAMTVTPSVSFSVNLIGPVALALLLALLAALLVKSESVASTRDVA